MSRASFNIIAFTLTIYLIISLYRAYPTYKDCPKPIHYLYSTFLLFFLANRILVLLHEKCANEGSAGKLISFLKGPFSFLLFFVLNVINTLFLVSICKDTPRCLQKSSFRVNCIVNGIIYFCYLVILIVLWGYFRFKVPTLKKQEDMRIELKTVYDHALKPPTSLSSNEIAEMIEHIRVLQTADSFTKQPISKKEEELISLLCKSAFDQKRRFCAKQLGSRTFELKDQRKSNELHEPLISGATGEIIGLENHPNSSSINKIQKSKNCTICFWNLEAKENHVVLKCNHSFHKSCLFEWLRIKPTCPMCRTNFRVDLLGVMKNHFQRRLTKTGSREERC